MQDAAADLRRLAVPPEAWSQQIQLDRAFQGSILPGVSRSFAITIPELPEALHGPVTNAYLLCRIADTIEDHLDATPDDKAEHFQALLAVVEGQVPAVELGERLLGHLSSQTPPSERELIRNTDRVVRVTHALPPWHQHLLARHLRIMCEGMVQYDRLKTANGLHDLAQFEDYCYRVSGVIGELLTALFCEYSPRVNQHRTELMELAVPFGQGLQMANVLLDLHEDYQRGVCWLPRDVLAHSGCDPLAGGAWWQSSACGAAIRNLAAIAHDKLLQAERYTLLLPVQEQGLRRFCAFPVAMALLSLRQVVAQPPFSERRRVKINRRTVRAVVRLGRRATRHDWLLHAYFAMAGRGVPRPHPAVVK